MIKAHKIFLIKLIANLTHPNPSLKKRGSLKTFPNTPSLYKRRERG